LDFIIELLNLPFVRAFSVLFSAVSLGISIWLFRKTVRLFSTQERHFLVYQTRFIDNMWQRSNALILSKDEYVRATREMFGDATDGDAVRAHMLFNSINPVYAAWRSASEGGHAKSSF
jgi:hypothetical protein